MTLGRHLFCAFLCAALAGCTLPPRVLAPMMNSVATYTAEAMVPIVLVSGAAGNYWTTEKKWPTSLDHLRATMGADDGLKAMLDRLSDVSFAPQPDGSLRVEGKVLPKPTRGFKADPMRFTSTVTIKQDASLASGWSVDVKANISGADKEMSGTRQPTSARGKSTS